MAKSIFDDEELAKYDHPVDDDDDDDVDEGIDWENEDEETKSEQKVMSAPTTNVFQGSSPWSTPAPTTWGTSGWGTSGQQYSPWGQQARPTTGQTWNPFGTGGTWGTQAPQWGQQSWGQTTQASPAPATGQQYVLPRGKRVIMCDFLDVLLGSWDAQGKLGVPPRGIYDIYLRRDIIERLRCIGAQWLYVLTNQGLQEGSDDYNRFLRMSQYVCGAVSEILGLPLDNVRCVLKPSLDPSDPDVKPGTGLIKAALKSLEPYGVKPADCLVVGSRSGFQYQSNLDQVMAQAAGIDYIDSQQLLTLYK